VEFGDEEHFRRWKSGFIQLIDGLKESGLWEKTILLDIEWAGAVDGAQHPQSDGLAKLGRSWRRLQRGSREASRRLTRGQGIAEALTGLRHVRPTEAEEYADRAAVANADYLRYRTVAKSMVASSVTRISSQVRISRDHKWGPQPFHYRDEDYRSIVKSILELVENRGTSWTNAKGKSRGDAQRRPQYPSDTRYRKNSGRSLPARALFIAGNASGSKSTMTAPSSSRREFVGTVTTAMSSACRARRLLAILPSSTVVSSALC